MRQENKGQRDSLTSLEWRAYQWVCWVCIMGVSSSLYIFYTDHDLFKITILAESIFAVVGYIFRYGLKNDIRVLDLRRFGGGD